jgi:hypothetical protein
LFTLLQQKFRGINEARIKEGIFVGSLIEEIMTDNACDETVTDVEIGERGLFKAVATR